jgi:biopolymer transport protein ExbB
MWDFFTNGGPLMYPLLFGSIITVAYGIERSWHYYWAGNNRRVFARIHDLIEQGKIPKALKIAKKTAGPVAAVLEEGLRHAGAEKAMIEEAVSLRGAAELERLNQRLPVLELIGRIAPLVGLLGTVLGMVEAFRQVAAAKGAVEPGLLAGGIWEALITTVAGLFVAIPAMVIHHFLEDRVRSFAFLMKHYGTEAVKHLRGRHA